jgi:histidyl-tRNA synthetase
VGFGAGNVTIMDFLKTRNLVPPFESPVKLYLCRLDKKFSEEVNVLANKLREQKIKVAVDLTDRKVGDQIKTADKQKIPFVICMGEDEIKTRKYKIKKLSDGQESTLEEDKLADFLRENS